MGVQLQLVLGVLLVSVACGTQIASADPTANSTTPENVVLDKPDNNADLIETSPKTEQPQLNSVNSNTQDNSTSVKSNTTELQLSASDEVEKVETLSNNIVGKEDESKENAIRKDGTDKADDRSRSIDVNSQKYATTDYHSKNNVDGASAVSDMEKYVDRTFDYKTSTENEEDSEEMELTTPKVEFFDKKYNDAMESIDQGLKGIDDSSKEIEDEGLQVEKMTEGYDTTPKSNFMDFEEMQSIKNNTVVDKNSKHKNTEVMQVKRVNIQTSYTDTKVYNDDDDDDIDESGEDDSREDNYPRGEIEKLSTTPKNNFVLTTRKTVTFTKPPVTRNNSYILSNNIETETFKAISFVSTESTTTRKSTVDVDKSHYDDVFDISTTEKIQENQIIPVQATVGTTTIDKVIAANPEKSPLPTTENIKDTTGGIPSTMRMTENTGTIRIEENLTTTIKSDEAVEEAMAPQISTSKEESTTVSEKMMKGAITTDAQATDSTTFKFPSETTAMFIERTEPLIEEILTTTLKDEPSIVGDKSSITSTLESLAVDQLTTSKSEATTTDAEEYLTTRINERIIEPEKHDYDTSTLTENDERATEPEANITDENTTETEVREAASMPITEQNTEPEVRTTETDIRTSKSMNLEDRSEAVDPTGSTSTGAFGTTFPAVTEILRRSTTPDATEGTTYVAPETTSVAPKIVEIISSDFTTLRVVTTTQGGVETTTQRARVVTTTEKPITTDAQAIVETTREILTTMSPRDAKTIPDSTEDRTVPPATTIVPTTIAPMVSEIPELTLPPEMPTETIEDGNYPTTTTRIITSTLINFVRVAKIDGNHTTLVPETLPPGVNYPPASTEAPADPDQASEDAIVNTTTEDGFETPVTEGAVTGETPGDNKGTIAAIVISTVGAVCLILLAGLLRQKRFNYGERCRPVSLDDYSVDNVSVFSSVRRKGNYRQSKRSYGNPAFDDPDAVNHPLNFPALAKFASNPDDMKAEFEEIPQIAARTSELPEGCETKNRFANVIPLPETRVCLTPIEGYPNSDYINANYVTGPKNAKGYYIATQAPMQNTVDDFWRMIWEQQKKCVDYLPPSEVLDCHRLFGDFQVTLKKRDVKDKYIISSLQLKLEEVTHFWYMGWPEKGVPTEANSLIAFLIEARSYMKSSTLNKNAAANGDMNNASAQSEMNPVVVHCSPGTGRTGVVIACDIAIREFEQTRLVDIPKIVYRIRRDRANAVQTKEQYMFIYKVVSLYATKLTGGSLDSLLEKLGIYIPCVKNS
ncbi:hypothetical protein NQ318_007221 [Aromia moschata]|uniref:protein-tyrosine-phosphatase n=1 Tax=Aromia moschata TaxID=1265417 RepID=A0AAV8Y5D1_9CUCU|nr:hypothetical protein NQ318_007221 [Aromia moschata]